MLFALFFPVLRRWWSILAPFFIPSGDGDQNICFHYIRRRLTWLKDKLTPPHHRESNTSAGWLPFLRCLNGHQYPIHWLSMIRLGPNERSMQTMVSKPVRTQWIARGSDVHHGNAWFTLVHGLEQSFGCGGRNFCCTVRVLRSRWILLQICYVTFRMMKFLGLLIGLQTFAVVSDSFWKHAGVICRTVNSIPWKIYIWSVKDMQLLPEIGSNHGNWSHLRFEPVRTPLVRTGANHGKPVIVYSIHRDMPLSHNASVFEVFCYPIVL